MSSAWITSSFPVLRPPRPQAAFEIPLRADGPCRDLPETLSHITADPRRNNKYGRFGVLTPDSLKFRRAPLRDRNVSEWAARLSHDRRAPLSPSGSHPPSTTSPPVFVWITALSIWAFPDGDGRNSVWERFDFCFPSLFHRYLSPIVLSMKLSVPNSIFGFHLQLAPHIAQFFTACL